MAFALAENLDEYFPKEVTGYLVTTTLLIVLFTIIILGGSTMPLLKVPRIMSYTNQHKHATNLRFLLSFKDLYYCTTLK